MCDYKDGKYIILDYFVNNKDINEVLWSDLIYYGYKKQENETRDIYYDITDDSLYRALFTNKKIFSFGEDDIIKLKISHEKADLMFNEIL